MRHSLFSLLFLLFPLCTHAQQYLLLWRNGEVVAKQPVTELDSVTVGVFSEGDKNFRYGYSLLTDTEKKTYDYIVARLLAFEDNADYYGDFQHRVYMDFTEVGVTMGIYDLMRYLSVIKDDMPQLFHLATHIPRSAGSNTYYARITKSFTPEVYAKAMTDIETIADELLSGITPTMTEYEKVKLIHDRYIDYGDYGGMSDANAGNLYGGIINKKAVCEGLSRTFLYLCQKVGVKCMYAGGSQMTSTDPETWGNHAWNFVQIDDRWYLVDMTADGAFPGHTGYVGFLRGQSYFDQNYRLTDSTGADANANYKSLPTLSPTDYK
ncbi:MAG: hypothetical protein HUK00_10025 [Bacteroidaceae bacterium]|nr:hypothetical protein [Bacteroidaceae bacterium]